MKRLVSFTLCAVMIITSLFSAGMYAFGATYGDFEYSLVEGGVTIDSYNGSAMSVDVPPVINDKPVVAISQIAFMGNFDVSDISLPSSVKTIGDMAFLSCGFVDSIALPENLETIGDKAFYACDKLKTVYLGHKVSGINEDTYGGCSGLTKFTVSTANPNYCAVDGVLFSKDKTELIRYPSGSSATSYTVPEGVKKIKGNAFYNAVNLLTVNLPKSLESIEADAFLGATAISDFNVGTCETAWKDVSVEDKDRAPFTTANLRFKDHDIKAVVLKKATCTEDGQVRTSCTMCGIGYVNNVDKLGHKPVKLKAVAPTYFKKGKTEGEKCSVCGDTLVRQKSVAKLVLAVPKSVKATPKKSAFKLTWKKNNDATGYIIQYSLKKDFSKKKTVKIQKKSVVKRTVRTPKLKKVYYVRICSYKKSGAKTVKSKWSKTIKVKTK